MESVSGESSGSDSAAGRSPVRDSARRAVPVERVTAEAITRRALRRALADDTATLSQLVSDGALDGSSGSSSGESESDAWSSDGDAGGGAPDSGALGRELRAMRRGMRKLRRVVRLQQRVVAAQQEILAVGAAVPVPLHADLAPFHGATARRLPRLDAASRRSLESALPRVAGFCRWVGPCPTYSALAAASGVSAPFLAAPAGGALAGRFLRTAESVAGLYSLVSEPQPPSDDDVRAGLAAVFRLLLGGVADMDTAGRLAGLRAVTAGRVPDSAGEPGAADALLADDDLSRLLEARKTVASFSSLAQPAARVSSGTPAAAAPSKASRRRARRKRAAAGSAARSRTAAAAPAPSGAGSGAPAAPASGRGKRRPSSAGGRSARQ